MMTTKQAAKILGIAEATVKRRLQAGTLKGEKLGRAWVVNDITINHCPTCNQPTTATQ